MYSIIFFAALAGFIYWCWYKDNKDKSEGTGVFKDRFENMPTTTDKEDNTKED